MSSDGRSRTKLEVTTNLLFFVNKRFVDSSFKTETRRHSSALRISYVVYVDMHE